jgi:hypothetical protein
MHDPPRSDVDRSPSGTTDPTIRFRQVGVAIIMLVAAVEAVVLTIGLLAGNMVVAILVVLVAGPIIAVFHAITIEVSVDHVRCFFGVGVPRRTIPVERIRGVRAVRTRVLDGWGIRLVRGGWLWNVSGFDAVELTLDDGRVFQMGTDRPAEVVEAIEAVTGLHSTTTGDP